MFEAIYWCLALNCVVASIAYSTDILRSSATIVTKSDKQPFHLDFLCDATLISYDSAVTTCECATQMDFVFPEFKRKASLEYNLTTRRNPVAEGYQTQRIWKFSLHPKCTSNNIISGFFSYNFALVVTEKPFHVIQKTLRPVELPALDYDTVNMTLWKALNSNSRCEIIGWDKDLMEAISVAHDTECEEKLCKHLGTSCPLSLQEKGLLCLSISDNYVHYDDEYPDYPDYEIKRQANLTRNDTKCEGRILSGSPLICFNFIMGVTAPGVCSVEVPIVIARIEPALEFIYNHMENGLSKASKYKQIKSNFIFILSAVITTYLDTN